MNLVFVSTLLITCRGKGLFDEEYDRQHGVHQGHRRYRIANEHYRHYRPDYLEECKRNNLRMDGTHLYDNDHSGSYDAIIGYAERDQQLGHLHNKFGSNPTNDQYYRWKYNGDAKREEEALRIRGPHRMGRKWRMQRFSRRPDSTPYGATR